MAQMPPGAGCKYFSIPGTAEGGGHVGRGWSRHPCLDWCPCDPDPDKWQKHGWMHPALLLVIFISEQLQPAEGL